MDDEKEIVISEQSEGIEEVKMETNTMDIKPRKKKTEKEQSVWAEVFSWVKMLVGAVILAYCINNFIIVNATVPTGSMNNTIMEGDRMIGLRFSYLFDDPKRGDIVIFKYPDDETQNYVKRVIGLPGDTIQIIEGKVYINGSTTPLEEDYLKETPTGNFGPFVVPEGKYFMMGDNREKSWDSRYWTNKYVAKDKILGKAVLRYWPNIKVLK